MIDLFLTDVTWNRIGGHPVLVYRDAGGMLVVPIGVDPDDARIMLAPTDEAPSGRERLYRVLGGALVVLGARLTAVRLAFCTEDEVQARLMIAGAQGDIELSAPATDGLILARWAALPVQVAADDLPRLRAWAAPPDLGPFHRAYTPDDADRPGASDAPAGSD